MKIRIIACLLIMPLAAMAESDDPNSMVTAKNDDLPVVTTEEGDQSVTVTAEDDEHPVAIAGKEETQPPITKVASDKQPFEASLKFRRVKMDMDVANGLGSVNNTNVFLFVSQTESGATLEKWGEAFELDFENLHHFTVAGDDYSIGAAVGIELFESKINSRKSLVVGEGLMTGYIDTVPIDGSLSQGAIYSFTTTGSVNSRYEVEFGRLHLDVRATRELNPNLKIGGSLYASLSRLKLQSDVFNPEDSSDRISLDQKVNGFSVGPCILLQSNCPIKKNVHIFLDAKVGLLVAYGDMEADQKSVGDVSGQFSADDSAVDIAGFGSLEGGLAFQMNKSSVVNLFGGAEYRNDSYEIVNPKSSPGTDIDDPDSFGGKSSYIESTSQASFYWGVEYTHTF